MIILIEKSSQLLLMISSLSELNPIHPNAISFDVTMTREQDASVANISDNILRLDGECSDGGLRFSAYLKANVDDGKIESNEDKMSIRSASSVTLLLSGATSYINQKDATGNPHELCEGYLKSVESRFL